MKFLGNGPKIGMFNPKENILFKNKKQFLQKLKYLKREGTQNLDFDLTLTKKYPLPFLSSYQWLRSLNNDFSYGRFQDNDGDIFQWDVNNKNFSIDTEIAQEIDNLFKKLIEREMTYDYMEEKIKQTEFRFRSGTLELISQSQENDVPFVIVSCGISYFIKRQISMFLEKYVEDKKQIEALEKNIKIYANEFKFDENGSLTGQIDNLVGVNMKKDFVSKIEDRNWRKNALILGNTFEDGMIRLDGKSEGTSIRCALHSDVHLDGWRYMTKEGGNFDVVIKVDGNLFIPLWILESVCDKSKQSNCMIRALEENQFDKQYERFIRDNLVYKSEASDRVVKWYNI